MIEVTRIELAELRGCVPSTISKAVKAGLPQTPGKGFDLLNAEVWEYVTEPTVKEEITIYKNIMSEGYEDNSQEGLEAREREVSILLKERRIRAFDLVYEKDKNNLIPSDLIGIWIGYFASGLRNNFLTIAARVARNNKNLRNKIEKEITKAIKKTLETAEKELKKYSEKLIETMEEEE